MVLHAAGVTPGRPRVACTYQLLRSQLAIGPQGPDATFLQARDIAVSWLTGKCPWLQGVPAAQRGASYTSGKEALGQHLEIIAYPDGSLWTARLEHPDAGLGDRAPPVAGRTWINDLSIQREGDRILVGIRITCASLPGCTADIVRVRPAIVRRWVEEMGLIDVRLLSGGAWLVDAGDLEALKALVEHPQRELPVIVLTHPEPQTTSLHLSEWVLDPVALARQLRGYAHVVLLPRQAAFRWTSLVGKSWSAFGGAVRTYLPGLRFAEQTPYVHPLDLVETILRAAEGDLRSERAYTAMLMRRIKEGAGLPTGQSQQPRVFVPQARVRMAEIARERIAALVAQAQAEAQRGSTQTAEQQAAWKRQFQEMQDAHIAEVSAIQAQLAEARAEAQDYERAWTDADAARKDCVRQMIGLKGQLLGLRERGGAVAAPRAYPTVYEDLPDWVAQEFPGRLVLHPRAVKALKDAVYEDVQLVGKALAMLADDYWTMRMQGGSEQVERFEAACASLGLQCAGSIAETRAGEQGDTYFVRWPLSGARRLLEFHLRKGKTKDDRICLAIYFFWDEDESCVVVGWLPSHLANRQT